jgi:hypothetical protein
MAHSPFAFKKRLAGPLTPSNSPSLKLAPRPSYKSSSHSSSLSIETVLGSTTSTPSGFDCLGPCRLFAYCAASSVVVGKVDNDFSITSRYFRANPTATSVNPSVSFYHPSTPVSAPETRGRTPASSKLVNGGTASPTQFTADRPDTTGSRTWTSRDRIKAATSVSLSPDGKFLAVGEVGLSATNSLANFAKLPRQDIVREC